MNLGKKIKPENLEFVENYKSYGFSTKTQVIDEALTKFRKAIARKTREKWKREALASYVSERPSHFWAPIEGDDFE